MFSSYNHHSYHMLSSYIQRFPKSFLCTPKSSMWFSVLPWKKTSSYWGPLSLWSFRLGWRLQSRTGHLPSICCPPTLAPECWSRCPDVPSNMEFRLGISGNSPPFFYQVAWLVAYTPLCWVVFLVRSVRSTPSSSPYKYVVVWEIPWIPQFVGRFLS